MGMDTNITKIEKVDDHTVKFTLKTSTPRSSRTWP
jgi:ABC-type transport system substrate-binding protein